MLGRVGMLRRYPVKSMLGQDVSDVHVGARGLSRDRGYGLVDRRTGKVASVKYPRLWRVLLTMTAEVRGDAVAMTAPDGRTFWSTDPRVDDLLSELVGRPVTLARTAPPEAELERSDPQEVLRAGLDAESEVTTGRPGREAPPGTFFDFAPLHLLTTSTLDALALLASPGAAGPPRYRPNILIDSERTGFVENDWVGRVLRIGVEVTVRVIARTPRCVVPTLPHGRLRRDPSVLRVLADNNRVTPLDSLAPQPCAGAYAHVLQPGQVRTGDQISLR
ncbi:MOSC N-terminal beta barrel domain-containing protein [Streptomyces sp. NPDC047880]|uniref:MOSC domain-containing protein n=1 Tax=Streptomyces sp. NPDC047880 TaxID=3155626 RepID=UPI003454AC5F